MTARRYVLSLLLLIAVVLAAIAAFNRIIDPFWYYRDIEIAGLNAVKPRFARFERNVKPALLARERPEAVVFGSSFAEIGFDPQDEALTDNGKLRGYNFALAGTGWDMEQCAFDYALRHSSVRRAVLGIHPGALPKADCARVWQGMGVNHAQLLLSAHAFNNSVRTVLEQRRARPSHTREGRYLYTRDVPGAAARFREYFQRDAKRRASCALRGPAALKPPETLSAVPSIDLEGLRAVIRGARAHGTRVAFVIYPRHALSLELEFSCDDPDSRWRLIAALARAVHEEAPAGEASLWVFDGYDAPRGERVIGREPVYWQDPEHFNFELGARMLATIYGREQGFGSRVVPGNVETLHRQLMAQREQYLAVTDWFYGDLRALAAPASAVR